FRGARNAVAGGEQPVGADRLQGGPELAHRHPGLAGEQVPLLAPALAVQVRHGVEHGEFLRGATDSVRTADRPGPAPASSAEGAGPAWAAPMVEAWAAV